MSPFGATRDAYSGALNYVSTESPSFLGQEARTIRTMIDKTNPQNKVWERTPHIWYRRPIDDTYTIEKANVDLLAAIRQYPDLLNKYAIGGNTNGVTHIGP